jgi:hypothetical protein
MRAELPGGSGFAPPILAHPDRQGTIAFSPASQVSSCSLLCVTNVSSSDGRRGTTAHRPFTQAPAAAAPCPGRKPRLSPGTRHQPATAAERANSADALRGQRHDLESRA